MSNCINILPNDFNPIVYQRLNRDLFNHNNKELISHYFLHGKKENRKYKIDLPNDFNPQTYRELNNDLHFMTNDELILHYIKYGFIESRIYKCMSKKNMQNYIVIDTNSQFDYDKLNIVYLIGNISQDGGLGKYYNDIIEHYKNKIFVQINSDNVLDLVKFKQTDIVLIKSLLNTNITVDSLLNKSFNNAFIIITVHDFVWLSDNQNYFTDSVHTSYLDFDLKINSDVKKLFEKTDLIIHPSEFTYDIYSKYFPNKNFIQINHPDIVTNNNVVFQVPHIQNKTINIFMPSKYTIIKGAETINKLIKQYQTYNGYNIRFFIVGDTYFNSLHYSNCINISSYDENEFFQLIKIHNIHGLLYLNKFGETWSYSLTKGLVSALPLMYSYNGAYIARVKELDAYFKVDNTTVGLDNIFENFLDYIIINQSKEPNPNSYDDLDIVFPKFYDMILKS